MVHYFQTNDGHLVISNVVAEDNDKEFFCQYKNLVTRFTMDGTHYNLKVSSSES